MHRRKSGFPPGTLDLLLLTTLDRRGPLHGYGIVKHIQQTSENVITVEEGSLYPALQRLLRKGWVTAEWVERGEKRRARFYSLTPEGRRQLESEANAFDRVIRAIVRVLQPA